MLRPQYTRRPFEIMLLGPPYSGKRTISAQFLKCRDVYFSINVSNDLPKKNIERTDFILLMLDMTNKDSLRLLSQALSQLETSYLSNKLAIVLTKVDIPEKWTIEKRRVEEIVEPYSDLQLFYVNLSNHMERKVIVEQITRLIKINTLQYQHLDIEYVKSQEYYDVEPEVSEVPEEGSSIASNSYHSSAIAVDRVV